MDLNNNHGWNIDIEKMLAELEDKSWGYTWMHKKSVSYFSKLNERLSITNIIFSLISGTSTFATLNTCSGLLFVQIGTGIVIYAAALLSAIQHFKGYAERIEKHKQAASKYSTLYHSIKKERVIRPEQRQTAKDYITWITNQYDSLLLSSPDIEDDIMNLYVRQYKIESEAATTVTDADPQIISDPVERARAFPIEPIVPIENYEPNQKRRRRRAKRNTGSSHYKQQQRDQQQQQLDQQQLDQQQHDQQQRDNQQNDQQSISSSSSEAISAISVPSTIVVTTVSELQKDKENKEEKSIVDQSRRPSLSQSQGDMRRGTNTLRYRPVTKSIDNNRRVSMIDAKHSDVVNDLRMRMNSQLMHFDENAIEYEMERLNRNI